MDRNFKQFEVLAYENSLLKVLKPNELLEFYKLLKLKKFKDGSVIVREGVVKESGFYIILSGWVKVVSYNDEGKEQIYTLLTRNDYFGEMSILENRETSASIIAKDGDCQIFTLAREQFLPTLEKYPLLAIELLKTLSARIRSANKLASNLAFMSAQNKLKLYLLDLLNRKGERTDDGRHVIIGLPKQREIGSEIGHRRETVARELKKLKDKGIIDYSKNKVVVYNENDLQV